jgi:hypothetical protein
MGNEHVVFMIGLNSSIVLNEPVALLKNTLPLYALPLIFPYRSDIGTLANRA